MKDILALRYKNIFDIRQFKDFGGRCQDLEQMPLPEKRKIELVQGHQYYGIHRYFPQEMKYITLLRDPITRVSSAYQSYRRMKDSPDHWPAIQYTFEEWFDNKIKLHNDNSITRMLAFGSKEEDEAVPWGEVTEEHFELAGQRLNTMIYGVTELYDAFLLKLRKELGWKVWPFYSKANFSKVPALEVSDDLKHRIAQLNKWDMRLYDCALSKTVMEMDSTQVRRFKELNKIVGKAMIGRRVKRKIQRMLCA